MREVADKLIPVTREVWEGLSDLKRPKETLAKPLARNGVEHEKEGSFVELRI